MADCFSGNKSCRLDSTLGFITVVGDEDIIQGILIIHDIILIGAVCFSLLSRQVDVVQDAEAHAKAKQQMIHL